MAFKSFQVMLAAAASAGLLAGCGRHRQHTAGDPFLHSTPNNALVASAQQAHSDLQNGVRRTADKVERHLDSAPQPHRTINRASATEDPFLAANESPFQSDRSASKPSSPSETALPHGAASPLAAAPTQEFDSSPFAPEPTKSAISQTSATSEFPGTPAEQELTENPFETQATPANSSPKKVPPSFAATPSSSSPEQTADVAPVSGGAPSAEKRDDFEWANTAPPPTSPPSREDDPRTEFDPTQRTARRPTSNPFENAEESPTNIARAAGSQPAPEAASNTEPPDESNPFEEFPAERTTHREASNSDSRLLPAKEEPATKSEELPDAVEEAATTSPVIEADEPPGKFEFRAPPITQMSYTREAKPRSTTASSKKTPGSNPGWKAREPATRARN